MMDRIITNLEEELEDEFKLLVRDSKGDSEAKRLTKLLKSLPPRAFSTRKYVNIISIKWIKNLKTIKVEDPETGIQTGWFDISYIKPSPTIEDPINLEEGNGSIEH